VLISLFSPNCHSRVRSRGTAHWLLCDTRYSGATRALLRLQLQVHEGQRPRATDAGNQCQMDEGQESPGCRGLSSFTNVLLYEFFISQKVESHVSKGVLTTTSRQSRSLLHLQALPLPVLLRRRRRHYYYLRPFRRHHHHRLQKSLMLDVPCRPAPSLRHLRA
jgi:hypothetical protein